MGHIYIMIIRYVYIMSSILMYDVPVIQHGWEIPVAMERIPRGFRGKLKGSTNHQRGDS